MKRSLSYVLIAVLFLNFLMVLIQVPSVKAESTLTFSSTTSDRSMYGTTGGTYQEKHDAIAATTLYNDFLIGQETSSFISRGAIFFDTSSIPESATITDAVLSLKISDLSNKDNEFNITIQNGQPTYPHDPVENSDFHYAHYSGNGGSTVTDSMVDEAYWNITLTATGIGWINKDTTTKLCLRSNMDIDSNSTAGSYFIQAYSGSYGEYQSPKLYVTYTIPEVLPYSYEFYGPFSEETGLALNENVTVNVFSSEGAPFDQFTLNITYIYNSSTLIQFFQFDFEDGSTRQYWVDPSESERSTIYVFWANSTSYVINFLDTTGILNTYPYVTARRYINGSLYIVEKRKVDSYKSVLMNLIAGRTYEIRLGNEDVTYIFGELLMTGTTSVQLILRGVDFPKETLLTQKYVRVYAYRSNTTCIQIFFEDTSQKTASVDVQIEYADFSTAYNTQLTSQSFSLEWNSAESDITYLIVVTVTHDEYGTLTWKQILVEAIESTSPFNLAWLGQWGFDSSTLIPSFIILFVAGCFSALNAEAGAVLMCIMAIILTYIGWIAIPTGSLVTAITLAILMALVYSKRRGAISQ